MRKIGGVIILAVSVEAAATVCCRSIMAKGEECSKFVERSPSNSWNQTM